MNLGDVIPSASPEALDLIESMLQYSSRKRPTAAEYCSAYLRILKHEYFKGMNLQPP